MSARPCVILTVIHCILSSVVDNSGRIGVVLMEWIDMTSGGGVMVDVTSYVALPSPPPGLFTITAMVRIVF